MLCLGFNDSIKEGDGENLILILLFKVTNCVAIEAANFLIDEQLYHLRLRSQTQWSMTQC